MTDIHHKQTRDSDIGCTCPDSLCVIIFIICQNAQGAKESKATVAVKYVYARSVN
jgi:hypothetical protein